MGEKETQNVIVDVGLLPRGELEDLAL